MTTRPLAGVRVIEAAVLLNGSHLAALLGDLGADVIKIEQPGRGDYLRDILGQIAPHCSPAHLHANRNKRSVTLAVDRDEGRDIFWRLLATADVFVDGSAGNATASLGIGYEDQRRRQPSIIYCQYTGFGAHGPYASIPTHGLMMNALAGGYPVRMDTDGFVRPVLGRPYLGGTASGGEGTAAGAIHAAFHIAAALFARSTTGEGCYLDVSAADAVISSAWVGAVYTLNDDRLVDRRGLPDRQRDPEPEGSDRAKYQFYEASDGRIILFACIEAKFWKRFCDAVGREDLLDAHDEGAAIDMGHGDEALRRSLQAVFHTRTQREWIELAAALRIPIGPANRVVDLPDDPHLRAREIIYDAEHPVAGRFTHVNQPALVDGESFGLRIPAPSLGEHTDEVMAELGIDAAEIARLRDAKVV